jgi:hypothetical protein
MTTAWEPIVSSPRLEQLAESIDRSLLAAPPAELRQFVRKESNLYESGRERRRDRRYSLITNVIAVPVDEKLQTAGRPFVALSSGMSTGGIRLIHTAPSPTDRLLLEIECQPVQFLLTVLRSRRVGTCFEIAGQFEIDGTPPATELSAEALHSESLFAKTSGLIAEAALRALAYDIQQTTVDELVHWAGIADAVQILSAKTAASDFGG